MDEHQRGLSYTQVEVKTWFSHKNSIKTNKKTNKISKNKKKVNIHKINAYKVNMYISDTRHKSRPKCIHRQQTVSRHVNVFTPFSLLYFVSCAFLAFLHISVAEGFD